MKKSRSKRQNYVRRSRAKPRRSRAKPRRSRRSRPRRISRSRRLRGLSGGGKREDRQRAADIAAQHEAARLHAARKLKSGDVSGYAEVVPSKGSEDCDGTRYCKCVNCQ